MGRRPTRPAPDLLIALQADAAQPLYRQVYDRLRQAIVGGRLVTGARLPSTRALAAELRVARNTVTGAFEQLRAEGYVVGRRGGGTRVCDVLPDELLRSRSSRPGAPPASDRSAAAGSPAPALSRRGALLVAAASLFPSSADPPSAFSIGVPALDEFPVPLWSRLVTRRWHRQPALGMGDPAGYPPLRRAIAEYLSDARAVRCTWQQVVIVSGAQHGLYLAARLLLDPGVPAWLEDPGYPGARSAFQAAAARLVPVPVDGDGLVVSEGRRRAPRARLVHVTPSHQFPLGGTMSPRRRLELLSWAREVGAWVLEDDYDSEFRYVARPLPSLQGMDAHDRVLYLGSFSKTLFPALRIGYLVLPEGLVDAFAAARSVADRHPPLGDQAVVADFLEQGHFVRHLRRMRKVYVERQQALVEAAGTTLDGLLEIRGAAAGIHLVGSLPPRSNAVHVAARAARHGVTVTPLSRYAMQPQQREALLLGYAAVPIPAIHRGVARLAAALGEA